MLREEKNKDMVNLHRFYNAKWNSDMIILSHCLEQDDRCVINQNMYLLRSVKSIFSVLYVHN